MLYLTCGGRKAQSLKVSKYLNMIVSPSCREQAFSQRLFKSVEFYIYTSAYGIAV